VIADFETVKCSWTVSFVQIDLGLNVDQGRDVIVSPQETADFSINERSDRYCTLSVLVVLLNFGLSDL